MGGPSEGSVSDLVKTMVGRIPRGRVATYGTISRVAMLMGRPIGGARTVAWILARLGGRDSTPWHRVIGAGGKILLPDDRGARQARRLRAEGVRFLKGVITPSALLDETALVASFRRAPPAGTRGERNRIRLVSSGLPAATRRWAGR